MNSCVEDNLKEDLLQWTPCEAGRFSAGSEEEVCVIALRRGCPGDILWTDSFSPEENLDVQFGYIGTFSF